MIDPVFEMGRAVMCLALEVDESIHDDVTARWHAVTDEVQALREIINIAIWPDDVVEDGSDTLLDGRFSQEMVDDHDYPDGGWVRLTSSQATALKRALKSPTPTEET